MERIHMGEQLEKIIEKQFTISEISTALGINRRLLICWFNKELINKNTLDRFTRAIEQNHLKCKVIKLDSKPYSEVKMTVKNDELWKDKYIELLEQMNLLVENLNIMDKEDCK